MLESFPIALAVGTILGILSGLGTGGGSLLILWLTMVLDVAQPEARLMNLLFFLPSALVSSLFRWKKGHLRIKKVLPAIIAGSIAAGISAFLCRGMDTSLLQKLFGVLLVFTGIRELRYRPKTQ